MKEKGDDGDSFFWGAGLSDVMIHVMIHYMYPPPHMTDMYPPPRMTILWGAGLSDVMIYDG